MIHQLTSVGLSFVPAPLRGPGERVRLPVALHDLSQILSNLTVRRRPGRWCMVSGAEVPADVSVVATVA